MKRYALAALLGAILTLMPGCYRWVSPEVQKSIDFVTTDHARYVNEDKTLDEKQKSHMIKLDSQLRILTGVDAPEGK